MRTVLCVCAEMAEAVEVAPAVSEQLAGPSTDALIDADERRQEEERRRARDPPIIYRDIVDVSCILTF